MVTDTTHAKKIRTHYNTRDAKNKELLQYCALTNKLSLDTVKKTVLEGADVNAQNKYGYTPLFFVVSCDKEANKDQIDIIRFFLDKGASLHLSGPCNYRRTQPVFFWTIPDRSVGYALHKPFHTKTLEITKKFKIGKFLLQNGADINCVDSNGDTLLLKASINQLVYAVKLLIEHGADVNAKNKKGQTALHCCLVKRAFKKRYEYDDVSCCKYSSFFEETIQCLLENGVDKTIVDKNNMTAYDCAKQLYKSHSTVLTLLKTN